MLTITSNNNRSLVSNNAALVPPAATTTAPNNQNKPAMKEEKKGLFNLNADSISNSLINLPKDDICAFMQACKAARDFGRAVFQRPDYWEPHFKQFDFRTCRPWTIQRDNKTLRVCRTCDSSEDWSKHVPSEVLELTQDNNLGKLLEFYRSWPERLLSDGMKPYFEKRTFKPDFEDTINKYYGFNGIHFLISKTQISGLLFNPNSTRIEKEVSFKFNSSKICASSRYEGGTFYETETLENGVLKQKETVYKEGICLVCSEEVKPGKHRVYVNLFPACLAENAEQLEICDIYHYPELDFKPSAVAFCSSTKHLFFLGDGKLRIFRGTGEYTQRSMKILFGTMLDKIHGKITALSFHPNPEYTPRCNKVGTLVLGNETGQIFFIFVGEDSDQGGGSVGTLGDLLEKADIPNLHIPFQPIVSIIQEPNGDKKSALFYSLSCGSRITPPPIKLNSVDFTHEIQLPVLKISRIGLTIIRPPRNIELDSQGFPIDFFRNTFQGPRGDIFILTPKGEFIIYRFLR